MDRLTAPGRSKGCRGGRNPKLSFPLESGGLGEAVNATQLTPTLFPRSFANDLSQDSDAQSYASVGDK